MSGGVGTMRIGEVHAQLRKDFPDVELSKIRYYEDKGLVSPSRSRKGYRMYSERDVACLREAIRLAQEEFVPLRVVRLRLIEQGLLSESPASTSPRAAAREAAASVVSAPVPTAAPTRPVLSVVTTSALAPDEVPDVASDATARPLAPTRFGVAEVLSITGVEPEHFNQIQALGLIVPVVVEGTTTFSADEVRVVAHAGALLARGVDPRLLGSLRRIAEREVGVVEDATAAWRRGTTGVADDEARAAAREVAHEIAALRGALVERALDAERRS